MLDERVVSAVTTGNLKAISEQPAMLSNLAYSNAVSSTNLGQQNAVSNQQSGNQIGVSLVAKATNTISNLGPLSARSAVDVLSNNELAQTIAGLKSAVEAFTGSQGPHKLRRLLALDLRIDEQGRLVIPPSVDLFIPGRFVREDIQVDVSDDGVTIKVRTTVR